jgi:mannosyl-oligosaccharide glucosidase
VIEPLQTATASDHSAPLPRTDDSLTGELEAESDAYDRRFTNSFKLPAEYSTPKYIRFAQDMTSSMIGGIGYFQGESIVDRSFKQAYDDDEEEEEDEEEDVDDDDEDVPTKKAVKGPVMVGPTELFTGTPSRSFFPRGFYWDEGFHLAVIADWDNDLA